MNTVNIRKVANGYVVTIGPNREEHVFQAFMPMVGWLKDRIGICSIEPPPRIEQNSYAPPRWFEPLPPLPQFEPATLATLARGA